LHTHCEQLLAFTYYRGRVALQAILRALNVSHGDEVITQAFTCVAVPEAIMAVGASPVYADIELNGFTMDPHSLRDKINLRTRAIIVQHSFGIPGKMDEICQIAKEFGIPIVEDCCHTLASTYKGQTVGTFGVASFYSFEWGKPLVIGVGGSARVNDQKLRDKVAAQYPDYHFPESIILARLQLQYYAFTLLYRPSRYWLMRFFFHWLGSRGLAESNYNPIAKGEIAKDFTQRMPVSLQRRLVREMKTLNTRTYHGRWVTQKYQSLIRSTNVSHPVLSEDSDVVFCRYPLRVNNKDNFIELSRLANIELASCYASPIHPISPKNLYSVYYVNGSCPNAEKRCGEVVTLPIRAVSHRDICRTVKFLNSIT
jgi:perosamine synthetase